MCSDGDGPAGGVVPHGAWCPQFVGCRGFHHTGNRGRVVRDPESPIPWRGISLPPANALSIVATTTQPLTRLGTWLESLPSGTTFHHAVLALVVLLFFTANVPWHLDNYDQAKQAYVAFEIEQSGHWLYQTTPAGKSASKPPLMGWLSAVAQSAGVPWEWAFRLPSLITALALAVMLYWSGMQVGGRAFGLLAVAAFGLNLLTPRLATLVRTDMLLAGFIFVTGWIIYQKLRHPAPWSVGERTAFGCAMAGALLTKGPVIYAFLLPGLVLTAILIQPTELRRMLWSGWLAWLLPLGVFLAWGIAGLLADSAFYEDVVVRELLSRFQEGSRSDERPQPWWFYFPHLIHKFAPWSLFIAASFFISKPLRSSVRKNPALLWCVLWVAGGLVVMTLIPAKRVDRIYPLIPPMVLLVVEIAHVLRAQRMSRIATGACILGAIAFSGGYFFGLVPLSYHERTGGLVSMAEAVNEIRSDRPDLPLYLVRARDEGLLIYLNTLRFTPTSAFEKLWDSGNPALFLVSDRMQERYADRLMDGQILLEAPTPGKNESGYLLYER